MRTVAEDWEEKMIEKMAEVFKNMGMPVDTAQLRAMLNQFRSQFDAMGIDPEKLAKGDVNFKGGGGKLKKVKWLRGGVR